MGDFQINIKETGCGHKKLLDAGYITLTINMQTRVTGTTASILNEIINKSVGCIYICLPT
jgi:hypothetical protein